MKMISAREVLRKLPESFQEKIINESYLCGALDAAYNQPHRHYHNLNHVDDMLTKLFLISNPSGNINDEKERYVNFDSKMDYSIEEMIIAILFHDIVYVIGAKPEQNETASHQSANQICAHVFGERFGNIIPLIMATTHTKDLSSVEEHTTDELLISDLDMSAFSHPYEDFKRSNKCIEDEYLEVFDEAKVYAGRENFLTNILGLNKLFYTEYFNEANARNNIVTFLRER